MSETTDVIVIGGGPARSTVSTLLAKRGHKVTLFERERFPGTMSVSSFSPTATRFRRGTVFESARPSRRPRPLAKYKSFVLDRPGYEADSCRIAFEEAFTEFQRNEVEPAPAVY